MRMRWTIGAADRLSNCSSGSWRISSEEKSQEVKKSIPRVAHYSADGIDLLAGMQKRVRQKGGSHHIFLTARVARARLRQCRAASAFSQILRRAAPRASVKQ